MSLRRRVDRLCTRLGEPDAPSRREYWEAHQRMGARAAISLRAFVERQAALADAERQPALTDLAESFRASEVEACEKAGMAPDEPAELREAADEDIIRRYERVYPPPPLPFDPRTELLERIQRIRENYRRLAGFRPVGPDGVLSDQVFTVPAEEGGPGDAPYIIIEGMPEWVVRDLIAPRGHANPEGV